MRILTPSTILHLAVLIAVAVMMPIVDASAGDQDELRSYDLNDLVERFALHRPSAAVELGKAAPRIADDGIGATAPTTQSMDARDLLTRICEPAMVPLILERAEFRSQVMFLNAQPRLHRHVEAMLAAVRRKHPYVGLSVRLFLMSPEHRHRRYALPGLAWRPLPDQPGVSYADMTAVASNDMMRTWGGDPGIEAAFAPSGIASSGQKVQFCSVDQQSYLPLSLAPREVGVVRTGDTYDISASPTEDGRYVSLEVVHTRVELLDWRRIDLGEGDSAMEPLLSTVGEHIERAIPAGSDLIIATGIYGSGKSPRCGFLVVSPRIMDEIPATGVDHRSANEAAQGVSAGTLKD